MNLNKVFSKNFDDSFNAVAILASIIKSIQKDKRIGEKFHIDRFVIDEDDWKEGFVILP